MILNVGGGPIDDKPTVTLAPPAPLDWPNAFTNIRAAHIAALTSTLATATILTGPKQHADGIAPTCDPHGHLIEVGQTTAPDAP